MNTLYAHDGYLNTFMRMRTAAAQRAGPTELLGVGALPPSPRQSLGNRNSRVLFSKKFEPNVRRKIVIIEKKLYEIQG